ncbi:electron transfer flavoprotein subunit beta/FixA family protein [Formicincola oecophyllae]|uniref:Electron transfer flavoprotein subunit beta n=1 Tax=Formicincola oecophyllae TaxID=2558361 RepID=A0A4Y6UA30_9PROT|nr:electron transfer flavoprotein subunit beta/FixA family protein [Formicincola oecophyllae]QDH14323.1 electron transfer flavoprotein subunit beta/FixA family protein [Formicincola oecophyllae]
MKILVPVKRVVDHNIKPRVAADGTKLETAGLKHAMNPFDEVALEAALRLKESGSATEVVAVTMGPPKAVDVLRTALAMGATDAILVAMPEDAPPPEPLTVAKGLAALVKRDGMGLVIMGKQASDDDMGATGPLLAAKLGWPQATFASALGIKDGEIWVKREIDGGTETMGLSLPAVITADLRLNEPRFATLPNIMKARKKPIQTIPMADLGIGADRRLETIKVSEPPARQAGRRYHSPQELVQALKEAKVI